MAIIESRKIELKKKIVDSKDIIRLAKFIEEEGSSLVQKNKDVLLKESEKRFENLSEQEKEKARLSQLEGMVEFEFSIQDFEKSRYKSNRFESIKTIIENKQIKALDFSFRCYKLGTRIQVQLMQTEFDGFNHIEINGEDSIWVNGIQPLLVLSPTTFIFVTCSKKLPIKPKQNLMGWHPQMFRESLPRAILL